MKKTGSTVIEVLIATIIVAFALTGLAALMTNNVKNSAEADYRETAASIAQDVMERIRQRKTTVPWVGVGNFLLSPYTGVGCSSYTTKYNTNFFVSCSPSAGTVGQNNITVTVTVCWPKTTACASGDKSTTIVQQFYNY